MEEIQVVFQQMGGEKKRLTVTAKNLIKRIAHVREFIETTMESKGMVAIHVFKSKFSRIIDKNGWELLLTAFYDRSEDPLKDFLKGLKKQIEYIP